MVMKATHLIELLQQQIARHGDLEVVIHDADTNYLLDIQWTRLSQSGDFGLCIELAGNYLEWPPDDNGWFTINDRP